MPHTCCVPSCGRKQKQGDGRSYHEFPSEINKLKLWCMQIKGLKSFNTRMFICGDHFDEQCKVRVPGKMIRLKREAIPTLKLGPKPRVIQLKKNARLSKKKNSSPSKKSQAAKVVAKEEQSDFESQENEETGEAETAEASESGEPDVKRSKRIRVPKVFFGSEMDAGLSKDSSDDHITDSDEDFMDDFFSDNAEPPKPAKALPRISVVDSPDELSEDENDDYVEELEEKIDYLMEENIQLKEKIESRENYIEELTRELNSKKQVGKSAKGEMSAAVSKDMQTLRHRNEMLELKNTRLETAIRSLNTRGLLSEQVSNYLTAVMGAQTLQLEENRYNENPMVKISYAKE